MKILFNPNTFDTAMFNRTIHRLFNDSWRSLHSSPISPLTEIFWLCHRMVCWMGKWRGKEKYHLFYWLENLWHKKSKSCKWIKCNQSLLLKWQRHNKIILLNELKIFSYNRIILRDLQIMSINFINFINPFEIWVYQ